MSRSKQIGTAGENAVVKFLLANGWPYAERRILSGVHDKGDITGTPGLCWEVKAGKAAETASDEQIAKWLYGETETERVNANAAIGILVVKRRGIGATRAGEWWAVVDGGVFADLIYARNDGGEQYEPIGFPVRCHLANLVELLRDAGYGTPVD